MDILTKKQTKQYDYVSRYSGIYFYYNTEDSKYMYGLTKQLNDETTAITHFVENGDTLDSLSAYYYGRPDLFWIIADYNRIQDPFLNLKESNYQTIKIPSISNLKFNFKVRK